VVVYQVKLQPELILRPFYNYPSSIIYHPSSIIHH